MNEIVLFFHLDHKMPITMKMINAGSHRDNWQHANVLAQEPGRPTQPFLLYRNTPGMKIMLIKIFITLLYTLIQEL